ncbi:MAG: glycosyltransferase family 4 protein [Longimicrobiales bacterium]
MRILVVNWQDRLNPKAGGAEIHLHEIFGRLTRWGHEVHLLTSGFQGAETREEVDGIRVQRVGTRMSFGLVAPRYIRRSLGAGGFDIVVEDLNKVPVFTPLLTETPVILLVHHLFGGTAFQEASLPVVTATWLLEKTIPRVYQGVGVVAVSRSTAEDMRDRGLEGPEIAIVPNGVDSDRFSPSSGVALADRPTLLYLGRLKRYKRVDLILRAVARLREEVDGIRLLIAGRGDHEGSLRALAERLGLGETVSFLGYVSEEEKVRLFRSSWVHVLTSPKEGWGISALEAAACGTPTVASDSPGLRDVVLDGKTGTLVRHGDVGALAEALVGILRSPPTRLSMAREARSFAEGFSWEGSARQMLEIMEDWVAQGHSRT